MSEMEKHITCRTVDDAGAVFAEAVLVSRRGGGELEKIAGRRTPEVAKFLKTLKPDPKYQFVLMTPLGSGEYWGRNANGDYFPDLGLSYDNTTGGMPERVQELVKRFMTPLGAALPKVPIREFGYRTFLQALRYRHHVNKNPELAYGDIVISAWDPLMHRPEIIVRHWRERAVEVGAEDIISDIDEGKPRSISMGCKVPFDVCTICGNISRKEDDYCEHLSTMMGRVLPDGRVVAALNLFPRFFDLSDVTVPAAAESGVIEKVAQVRSAAAASLVTKQASIAKSAELEKKVSPNTVPRAARIIAKSSAAEAPLPKSVLETGSLAQLITTLGALGIVLRPYEFQYATLRRDPVTREVAERLMVRGECFAPEEAAACCPPFAAGDWSDTVAVAVVPHLAGRSGLQPFLPNRVLSSAMQKTAEAREITYVSGTDLAARLAAQYSAYRNGLTKHAEALVNACLDKHGAFYLRHVGEPLLEDGFAKTAFDRAAVPSLSECSLPVYLHNAYRAEGSPTPVPAVSADSPSYSYLTP